VIKDCRSCNPTTLSPIKIGDCSSRISLQPLREEEMSLTGNLSTHDACLGLFDGVSNWVSEHNRAVNSNLGASAVYFTT